MFFRLIQSIPLPGKWQHCRDSLKLHFDGHSGLSLPLTSVVKLWPPGHFGGALSAPAKCRESDGRTKEMICGQSSTLMVLTLHADHIVAAEYIVEMGWGDSHPIWPDWNRKHRRQILLNIWEIFLLLYSKSLAQCFSVGKQEFKGYHKDKCQLKVYTV